MAQTRRRFIQTVAILSAGCTRPVRPDGGMGSDTGSANPDADVLFDAASDAGLPRPVAAGRYRTTQRYLFQTVPRRIEPARIPGGGDRVLDGLGPTGTHVDWFTGWGWRNPGGDYIDADRVSQGPRPIIAIASPAAATDSVVTHVASATEAVRVCFDEDRWCAFCARSANAERKIASPFHTTAAPPHIDVTYEDGTNAVLPCRVVAWASTGSTLSNTTDPEVGFPCFLEFERPTRAVRDATLSVTVVRHFGSSAMLQFFWVDPPINTDPPTLGVAMRSAVGALDAEIHAQPGIIGAQRYLDGSTVTDFVSTAARHNTWAEREFDPALWGGASDLSKFPHRDLGKMIDTGVIPERFALVPSTHDADGFVPLAPGLGALRVSMPADATRDGDVVGYGGSGSGAHSRIYMPFEHFGLLDRIFVRYYFRLGVIGGGPFVRTPADRLHVYHSDGGVAPLWTDMAGKFGITPEHTTNYGGTSGSAGGGVGWQMRLAWAECDLGVGGPDEGGIHAGYHLYDFGPRNPPGYSYAGAKAAWGERGGFGGMLYAHHWYCVETELKLNSVLSESPGFVPDGELRAWIDGRLCFERRGMVFRTLPAYAPPANPALFRPVRDLGVRALWFEWYHGGVTQSSVERVQFYTGLAYGTEYIGPMRGVVTP